MAALATTRLTGRIALPNDANAQNTYIKFLLSGFDTDAVAGVTVLPEAITATVDASGDIDVDLWPNDSGTRGRFYAVSAVTLREISSKDTGVILGIVEVPSGGGSYDINDLIAVDPPAGMTLAEYTALFSADVASAEANADRAEAAVNTYSSRANAAAATVSVSVDRIGYTYTNGDTLWFKRDATGTALTTVGGDNWSPDGKATPEHFWASGTDARPAIQAMVDWLAAEGGGTGYLGETTYDVETAVTVTTKEATSGSAGVLVDNDVDVCISLPAGVSLVGASRSKTVIDFSAVSATAAYGIAGVLYKDGAISDMSLVGGSATVGDMHGVWLSLVTDDTHINENITIERLNISNFASYGIGHQYGHCRDVKYSHILIEDVGVDGIDHKIRFGPRDNQYDAADGVEISGITVRRHGQRLTGASGIDVRGAVLANHISVMDVTAGNYGVTLSSGTHEGDETRSPSARSVLTNFRITGADPAAAITGVHCLSGGPAVVSNGYILHCATGVHTKAATTTPSEWRDAPTISDVTVEGARAGQSFLAEHTRTVLNNCNSISDVQYFDAKRGNLVLAQTNFTIRGGVDVTAVVYLNDVATTAFTLSGDDVVMGAGVAATDTLMVVVPTNFGIRVTGTYCSVTGGSADVFHSDGVSVSSGAAPTINSVGFADEAGGGLRVRPSGNNVLLQATGPAIDADILLTPKGAGRLRLGTSHAAIGAETVTGYMEVRDTGGTVRKVAVVS